MWLKFICLISLTICFKAQSDDSTIVDQVIEINKAVKEAGTQPNDDCFRCSVSMAGKDEPVSPIKQCVESLCPNPEFSLSHLLNTAYTVDPLKNESYSSTIQPLIQEIAKVEAEDKLRTSQETLAWLRKPHSVTDPNLVKAINFFLTLGDFTQFEIGETPDAYFIDRTSSRAKFSNLTEAEFNKKADVATVILRQYLNQPIRASDPARIKILYPGDSFKSRVQEVATEMEAMSKKILSSQEFQVFKDLDGFRNIYKPEEINRIIDSEEINSSDIDSLNRLYAVMKLLVMVTEDTELSRALTGSSINISEIASSHSMSTHLQKRLDTARLLLTNQLKNNTFRDNQCEAAFNFSSNFLPSNAELQSFRSNEKSILNSYLDSTSRFMSTLSSNKVKQNAGKWFITYPLTKEAHFAQLKDSLSRTLSESKKYAAQNDEINASPNKDKIYAARVSTMLIGLRSQEEGEPFLTDASDVCEELTPRIVPDAAYSKTGGFIIGPLAVKFAVDARGVTNHELSHLLYDTLKENDISTKTKSWFNASRSCLLDNHSYLSEEEMRNQKNLSKEKGAFLYEEEDWADLISASIPSGETNLACIFARKNDDSSYKEHSLRNADQSDPHSSDFFRLLHINYIRNGNIPTACKQALSSKGLSDSFKNCAAAK